MAILTAKKLREVIADAKDDDEIAVVLELPQVITMLIQRMGFDVSWNIEVHPAGSAEMQPNQVVRDPVTQERSGFGFVMPGTRVGLNPFDSGNKGPVS